MRGLAIAVSATGMAHVPGEPENIKLTTAADIAAVLQCFGAHTDIAALERANTVRLGYGQVFGRACTTAAKIGTLLQIRGWEGQPIPCPNCASPGTTGKIG